jgi:chitin synthase
MTKAFESMFGGVTCLPGCFSMYRIKAPKADTGYWVPILANPDIVEHYSENVVDTLHKKNLLLLGEDRYLTTLMLKTFPRRKNMFCPSAVCKTVVPDTFRILLSQRRRWINSTVHNLFELVLVRDLCGTFCFSMQFVVGMELGGTLVLPAAISFTLYLIIISIIPGGANTTIPLVLLAIVLGLPGLLIVITSRKMAYVGWMIVYLFSLPIWNGILPLYAFWHFDDFSWGQTRMVAGEKAAEANHGDKEGEFDSSHIVMKRWAEFERERRWKSDTQSRDSTYYDPRNSPKRLSLISSNETFQQHQNGRGFDSPYDPSPSPQGMPTRGPRHSDSAQLLMLPTPLSVQRQLPSSSSAGFSRSSEDAGGYSSPPLPLSHAQGASSSSTQRLVQSQSPDRYYNDESQYQNMNQNQNVYEPQSQPRSRSSMSQPPVDGYRRPPSHAKTYDDQQQNQSRQPRAQSTERGRGGYTSDTASATGSASASDPVRRVPRSKRPSSTTPQSTGTGNGTSNRYSQATSPPPGANRYSPAVPSSSLPPGAAAPATRQSNLPPGAGVPAQQQSGRNRYID